MGGGKETGGFGGGAQVRGGVLSCSMSERERERHPQAPAERL